MDITLHCSVCFAESNIVKTHTEDVIEAVLVARAHLETEGWATAGGNLCGDICNDCVDFIIKRKSEI